MGNVIWCHLPVPLTMLKSEIATTIDMFMKESLLCEVCKILSNCVSVARQMSS